VSWSAGAAPAPPDRPRPAQAAPPEAIATAAAALASGEPCLLLLGGSGLHQPALEAASRIAAATSVRLLAETFAARHQRGAGRPSVQRLAYLAELATGQLAGVRHLILAGARPPVSFFAYPGQPGSLVPDTCEVHVLAEPGDDVAASLAGLADLAAARGRPVPHPASRPAIPDGELTAEKAAAVIGALLPEGAIVCDEAITSGLWLHAATEGAPPHDWLALSGGAIGQGMPLATGAATACRDRPVLSLEADGSALYTVTALWTQAREQLDVTTVIFSNGRYAVLGMELDRVGASGTGQAARDLLDLTRPGIGFAELAAGLGVPAGRARTAAELAEQLKRALAEPGPHLVEAVIPPSL
jgi:acetolactate synthase I/II/III large subunit